MASSVVSPWKTIEQRLLTREGLILRTSEIKNALPQLSTVRSCAMIGCGTGHNDLAFVRECCPNLTELAAVEPDAYQMAELKIKVSLLFPTVSVDFYQETAQSWTGSSLVSNSTPCCCSTVCTAAVFFRQSTQFSSRNSSTTSWSVEVLFLSSYTHPTCKIPRVSTV